MSLILATFLAGAFHVGADNTLHLLDAARKHYKAGEISAAFNDLTEAKMAVFQRSPLHFNEFLIVEEPGEAFGVYKPRQKNVFHEGESIFIYCEPVGYTFEKKEGMYRLSLNTDFVLYDDKDHVLASREDFATYTLSSHHANTELMLNITYKFSGVYPGSYRLKTIVRDPVSGKSATHILPLTFE